MDIMGAVEVVQADGINRLIADQPKLLLFFVDAECLNCAPCSSSYALASQENPQVAYFAKIYLSPTNR